MLTFIKEKETVWENLKSTSKPIVLYGMGNGADKLLDWCEANAVAVAGIFATDEFVRYQQFRGFTVRKYSDIIAELGQNILIVIAFASERPEVLARFAELAALHETLAPHLPLFSEKELVSPAWLAKYEPQLEEAYSLLADEQSRQVFASVLNYKLSGKLSYLFACTSERLGDLQTLLPWQSEENYLDLGAYNGDTIKELLCLSPTTKSIIALEPDRRNCRKLRQLGEDLAAEGITCEIHECGSWCCSTELSFSDSGGRQSSFCSNSKCLVSVDTVDHIVGARPVSYIKMDVEGAEKQTLRGGSTTIRTRKPKLFIAAYHYDNDLWELPLLLHQLVPEYKLYLRKHPYVPCWEINYLARV